MNTNKSKKTLEQLARSLGVDLRDVTKSAKRVLRIASGAARDPQYMLSPNQCKKIQDDLTVSEEADQSAFNIETESTQQEASEPALSLKPDPPAERDALEFGDLSHGLWFHPDVFDSTGPEHLKRRVGIVLQHLAAHGRTSVVKGCRDNVNRGWFRSPLGGNGGMHYYLWWTPQGNQPVKGLGLSRGDILIRAVRHHDDHSPLEAGKLDDCIPLDQQELEADELVGRPWTEEQLKFVESDAPVRSVIGKPGAGKTTILWKAIDARSNQRVLYLTWSRDLTRYAEEHFASFAPVDVQVETRDFVTFLGEICKVDLERRPPGESRATFDKAISRVGPQTLGPWVNRSQDLFAEIRAVLLGRAVPGEEGSEFHDGVVRLGDREYRSRRGKKNGIGKEAAHALTKIVSALEEKTSLSEVFPELQAARQAIEFLRNDSLPEGFNEFDRIVVDEVQDLTLVESAVIIELCRAIARDRGHAPWVLFAGDEGQTVRPSGFEWGTLNELVGRRIATPRRFLLEENLRCPQRIADVIERASDMYSDIKKVRRPGKQGRRSGGQHVEAHLFHVNVERTDNAVELLEQLDDVEDLVVLTPDDTIPEWVPESLGDTIMTSAEAKGLEYQSVCLLDPGSKLAQMDPARTGGGSREFEEHARRTTIDQLRVALSRATETLVFIDVGADDATCKYSFDLMGDSASYDPDDLLEHFTNKDTSVDDRVLIRTKDARALIDDRPARAWQRAYQATRLLGHPERPNGVANNAVRHEAHETLVATAARLLVDGFPTRVHRDEVVKAAHESLKELKSELELNAFDELNAWSTDTSNSPHALLDAIIAIDKDCRWLRNVLSPVTQIIRRALEDGTRITETASRYADNVEEWLRVTNFVGNIGPAARQMRSDATNTLLAAGDLDSAESVLKKIDPEDAKLTGRLRETQGRSIEAAEAFERDGPDSSEDALRNWRDAGQWEKAVRFATNGSAERQDLEWIVELDSLISRRPRGQMARLTDAEQDRLGKMVLIHS
jgi:hypothetical protein